MSTGTRLAFDEAYALAKDVAAELSPYVARLKAVGSLRRKRLVVGDIEFLAEPLFDRSFFGEAEPALDELRTKLRELGTWVRGQDRQMVINDLYGRPGVRLDLYLVHPPAEWFPQLCIRTGPAELGKYVVTEMRAHGYRQKDGRVVDEATGAPVKITSEAAWFGCAGLACVAPGMRDRQMDSLRIGTAAS